MLPKTEISRLGAQFKALVTDLVDRDRELARLAPIADRTDNLVVLTDRHGNVEWVNAAL